MQFCRLCGANLGVVRDSLAESDNYTASAIKAREEIARAAAEKIRTGDWWQVTVLLPEVEKLFESPPERLRRQARQDAESRLGRLRGGTITAAVGLGLTALFVVATLADPRFIWLAAPGLFVFLIGLTVVLNGLFFTVPKGLEAAPPAAEMPPAPEREALAPPPAETLLPNTPKPFRHLSVVENTTRDLADRED
ncbi:MAG: hypothetical protein JSS81_08520 [Acidobacteria bacterium]|nr:hypothetical protein [Acidobacteriota bacterium]